VTKKGNGGPAETRVNAKCRRPERAARGKHVVQQKKFYQTLYFRVLCAIVIGVLLGHFWPKLGADMKPLGDGFIKLIKMLIAPIIFCTVVTGIASMESMKRVGRVGLMAIVYFEILTTIALIVGMIVMNVLQPGVGMNVDPAMLDQKAVAVYAKAGAEQSTIEFVMNVIPNTVVDAFAKGEILQVLLFSILFGFGLFALGDTGKPLLALVEKVSSVLFRIVGYVMVLAPIGAFGAMAFTIGRYGVGSLVQLGQLMATFYATCLVFVFVVLGTVARMHGFSIWRLIKYIKEELFIVLGTSSSESVLPRLIAKMEVLGCEKTVVGLVIPAGYSFNLDGTCIYLTLAALFIAQATNVDLTIWHQITLLLVLLLTSKGAAGVTGSGFIVLAATLSSVNVVPVAGLALILGIDRFMSEARALTNLVGNAVATIVVAKWNHAVDETRLERHLAHETTFEADSPERALT
jgi:aerobic C4-dicarboxylate transport protein